jgi:mevalonate pyrophosphate decarboxylase
MEKLKCRKHAEELHAVLENDNSPQRRKQVMQVMDATREHKDIWEDVFSDQPDMINEMNDTFKRVSKPRMLID